MGTDEKRYRLKIRRDGVVRYMMEDGSFWNPKYCPHLQIHLFTRRIDAQNTFVFWQRKYPATASEWMPEIEEV